MNDNNQLKSFHMTPLETSILCMDIVDSCNLRCTSCVRGNRYMKNHRKVMDYELFKKIINKASQIGIHSIELFNWTEPFLCTELEKYAYYIKKMGLICHISSNLALPNIPHLIPTLRHCEFFVVTVSGFTQDIYKINHRGGNIEVVKKNLERIGNAKKSGEINLDVYIHYLIFDHSKDEFEAFKDFAESHGLIAVPWRGLGLSGVQSSDKVVSHVSENNEFIWCEKNLTFEHLNYPHKFDDNIQKQCLGSITPIPIDCEGNVFQCVFKPSIKKLCVGNFLDDDFDIIQYRRFVHPACTVCRGWYRDHPIIPQPYHKMSLLRGMIKYLNLDVNFGKDLIKEMNDAQRLEGKKVYFWGCGDMYRRKRHVFSKCDPVCILVDTESKNNTVGGLQVMHPDDVLVSDNVLPIIIFADRENQKKIFQTIKTKYPLFSDIIFCSTL